MNGRAGVDADACDVAAGTSQTLSEAGRDGIAGQGYDRNFVGLALEQHRAETHDVDDIRIVAGHLRCQGSRTGCALLLPVAFDYKILSINMPEAAKFGEQRPVIAVIARLIHNRRWLGRAEDGEPPAGA